MEWLIWPQTESELQRVVRKLDFRLTDGQSQRGQGQCLPGFLVGIRDAYTDNGQIMAKTQTFVVSLITEDNDYQVEQAAAAEGVARALGVQLKVIFADSNSIQQSQQVLEFIQCAPELRPDGIILEPVGGTALPQVARAAAQAGIGWVVLNRHASYLSELRRLFSTPAFAVSTDNQEVGRIQGRQIATLLPRGGAVLYIQGPSESDTAKLRHAGLEETKPARVQMMAIRGQWTEHSACKAVTSWLQPTTSQRIQVDLVAAQNDAMAIGAREAFQQYADRDRQDHWTRLPFLGVDGLRQTGMSWAESGVLAATVVTPPLAGKALEMLVAAVRSSRQQQELTLVTPCSYPALESLRSTNGRESTSLKKGAAAGLD